MTIREKLNLYVPPVVKDAYIKNLEELCPDNDYPTWFLDREASTFSGGFSFNRSTEGSGFWIEARDNFNKIETLYTYK